MTTFHQRRIEVEFQLGVGSFGSTGKNTTTLKTHRVTANISKAGGISNARLDMRIYGMALDVMQQLTILNQIGFDSAKLNQIVVSVGDDDTGLSVAFVGIINEAWIVGQSSPDIEFHVVATSGHLDKIRPVKPTSYNGSIDVATIIAGIGEQMTPPRALENSGVNVQLSNPYFPGTLIDQLRAAAQASYIHCILESNAVKGDIIAIWPLDKPRNGAQVVVSSETGMVGYPSFSGNAIQFTTLYNPTFVYGCFVEVRSVLFPAPKRMIIASITHNLESETVGGAWFTEVTCGLDGQDTPIVQ